jgi:hypoxanthine phosphoribosyltransferase
MTAKNHHYSWRQFDGDMKKIISLVKKSGKKFDGVWGPSRGGLVPAVMLSHGLGLPLLNKPTRRTLVIDDIADTGRTLVPYKGKNFIVTPFYHKQSIVVPDVWLREKKNQWIIFPWEPQH